MSRANVRFNYHDYLQLPEDKRYEILDGELHVVPAPNVRHQRLLIRLIDILLHHTRDNNLGETLIAPCDVILSEENVVQPDILFISSPRQGIVGENNVSGAPDLVVEILSPTTAHIDRGEKAMAYRRVDSIEEYVLVAQSEYKLAVHRRAENWTPQLYAGPEAIAELRSISLTVPLAQIYAGTLPAP